MTKPDLSCWRRRPGEPPFIFGHRGASHTAPENTLAAFELARQEGADGVELDVRLDADGEVLVGHDATLKRVTGGNDLRSVASLTRAQLREVDVGDGERLPELSDVLAWAEQTGMRVNIELKSDLDRKWTLVRRTAELVRGFENAPRQLLLSTFHPAMLFALTRLVPGVPVGWLVHNGQRIIRELPGRGRVDTGVIHPQRSLVNELRMQRWKRARAVVNVWTVNELVEATRLSDLGVDTLVSDHPGDLASHLR